MEPIESGCEWEEDPVGNANSHDGRTIRRDLRSKTNPVRLVIAKRPQPAVPAEIYSIGMERVGYSLGTTLGLPVPETYLETFEGEHCSLQRRLLESVSWRQLQALPNMLANVSNAGLYAKAALFDIWLANIDRRDVNLLFEAEPVGEKCAKATRCRMWLIDHGLCGLWPASKFDPDGDPTAMITDPAQLDGRLHPRAEKVIRDLMPHPYRLPLLEASGDERATLLDAVRQVVDDDAISKAVQEVPEHFMAGNLRAATEVFLKVRRARLDEVLDQYWQP